MVKTLPSSKNWTRSNRKKRSISSCFTTSIVILLVIYLYYLYHLYYFDRHKHDATTKRRRHYDSDLLSKNMSYEELNMKTFATHRTKGKQMEVRATSAPSATLLILLFCISFSHFYLSNTSYTYTYTYTYTHVPIAA